MCPGWASQLPEICPPGFVCNALGLSYPTVLCPAGYFCHAGTVTTDPSAPTPFKPQPCRYVGNNVDLLTIPSQRTLSIPTSPYTLFFSSHLLPLIPLSLFIQIGGLLFRGGGT